MAIIDKIQLSGTVYTIGNETTTAVTSASTDNEIPTAKAVYDAIPQGGGGKAVSGGTNISVTTGETADTINCTLPISVGGSFNSCLDLTRNAGNSLQGSGNVAFGSYVNVTNNGELGIGRYNVSNTTTTAPIYNNPNKTVFSVGNGTGNKARHNAFEIRQNGDIYLNDGSKLQDTVSATTANTTALGGLSLVKLTQAEYDALATKDSNVLYVIVG